MNTDGQIHPFIQALAKFMFNGRNNPNRLSLNQPSSPVEYGVYQNYLDKNSIKDAGPTQDYDYLNAFRAGIGRGKNTQHFPDTYKMPWHESFSNESQYYQPGMPAVQWMDNGQNAPYTGQQSLDELIKHLLSGGSY